MNEPEGFISRWSRLKRRSAIKDQAAPMSRPPPPIAGIAAESTGEAAGASGRTAPRLSGDFDPASLPSIASIDAHTVVSGFLQSDVPVELARAALRRAWVTDPLVRDFVGIAESQWDFTDPQAIPGFGPIPASSASLLVARAMGQIGMPGPPAAEKGRLEEGLQDAASCPNSGGVQDLSTS
jgi:hypothetical protein